MKRLILHFVLLTAARMTFGQGVGIGTATPHASAAIEVSSVTKGMLMPRMTTAQRDSIAAPAAGLVILNLDDYCMDIFDGTYWSKNCGLRITGIDSLPDGWASPTAFGGIGRAVAVSFVIGDKAYVGTGISAQGYLQDLWEFNPVSANWVQKADLPGEARGGAVGFHVSGKGYIATGYGTSGELLNDVYEYNPQSNMWVTKADFPGSARRASVVVERPDQMDALLIGGYPASNDTWKYLAGSDEWVSLGYLPVSIYGAVGFYLDSTVIVGTGTVGGSPINDFYAYNGSSNQWSFHSTMGGVVRTDAAVMVIGESAYVGTGITTNGNFLSDFWKYNTSSGWTPSASLPAYPRAEAVGFAISGTGYLATGSSPDPSTYFDDVWAFEPSHPQGFIYESPLPPPDAFVYNDGIWSRDSTDNIFSDAQFNVGIGTESPDARLHVNGSFKVSGDVQAPLKFSNNLANRKVVLYEIANNDHQYFGLGIDGNALRYQVGSTFGAHVFFAGTAAFASAEIMRIQGDGNIGIGINAATNKLDIQSGLFRSGSHATNRPLYVTGALQESSGGIEFRHENGTQGIGFGFNTIYAAGSNSSQDLGLASKGTGILKFSTDGLERLRVTGAGNVGIGTTTPNAPLQLGNTLVNRKLVLWEGQNNDHQFYGFGVNSNTLRYQVSNANDNHIFYAGTSVSTSQELMRIKGNGNVTITGLIENEAYAAPNFLNGFTNYGNGYVAAGYYKDKQGIVRLRGTVYKNSSPNGQGIFVLPAGYRPSSGTVAFSVGNNGGLGLVEVLWDGSVFVQNCVAGWISLDSIVFRAD